MQSVILAAGEGKRMRPLTNDTPKPLVKVAGKPLISHVMQAVPAVVTEFVIVTGYLGQQIKDYFGDSAFGRNITYINQPEKRGTGDALSRCENVIVGPFLYLNADDLFAPRDLEKLTKHNHAMLAMEHDEPERFGVIKTKDNGTLERVIEKPKNPPSQLVCVGPMMLSEAIFSHKPTLHESGELIVHGMVDGLAQDEPIAIEEADFWFPVATPEDVSAAEKAIGRMNL